MRLSGSESALATSGRQPTLPSACLFVEHMQDGARQKGMGGFGPVVDEALAVGVDEDGDEILHVAHLVDGAQAGSPRGG